MAEWADSPLGQPGLDQAGGHHPPVTHDGDDHHSNEEDQASCRGADDEWQLLLDACLVLGWGESTAQCSQPGSGDHNPPHPHHTGLLGSQVCSAPGRASVMLGWRTGCHFLTSNLGQVRELPQLSISRL